MLRFTSIVTALLAIAFGVNGFAASASGITYQGRILKPDDTPVAGVNTQFRMQIRTTGTDNCVMYEELHEQDLSDSKGNFSLTLNDGNGVRQDTANYDIDQIFANKGTFTFASTSCPTTDVTYSPGADDHRVLVVEFKDETMTSWEPMPPQTINYVPMALQAKNVAGFGIGNLVRVQEADGSFLSNVTPLSNANYDALKLLVAGTSALYEKPGKLGGIMVPSMGTTPGKVLGWDGSAWTVADPLASVQAFAKAALPTCAGGAYLRNNAGALECTTPAAGTTGTVTEIRTGTGLTGGPINDDGDIALAAIGAIGTGYKVSYDIYGRVTGATSIVEADIPTIVTPGKVSGAAITSGQITGATSIDTTGVIKSPTGSFTALGTQNIQVYKTNNAYSVSIIANPALNSNYTLTLPVDAGANGQVLTTNGSGGLAWSNAASGSVTSLTGDVTSTGSGAVATTIAANAVSSGKIADGSIATADLADANVTFAKVQNVPTTTLVGRYSAGSGAPESLTLGTGLALSGAGVLSSTIVDTDTDTFASALGACANGTVPLRVAGAWTCGVPTPLATNSALVQRDGAGSFAANVVTANGLALNNGGSIVNLVTPMTAAYSLTLPATVGAGGQVLTNTGSGVLGWTTPTTGTGDFKADGTVPMTGNIRLGSNWLSGDGGNEGVYVDASGNVGIGTTNPVGKLGVNGSIVANAIYAGNLPSTYGMTSGSGGASLWMRVASVRIDTQYQHYVGKISVQSDGAGQAKGANALIGLRVKQNATMAGGSPMVNIEVDSSNSRLPLTGVVGVLSTDTAALKVVEVYVKPTQDFELFSWAVTGGTGWHAGVDMTEQTPSALPAGTTIAATPGLAHWTMATSGTGISYSDKVGIGTTTPGSALDVQSGGSVAYTPTSVATNIPNGTRISVGSNNSLDGTGGFLVLNATNSASTMNSAYIGAISTAAGVRSPSIVFGQRTGSPGYDERMRLDPNGNFGIGTTNPTAKLDVKGDVRISGSGSGYVGFAVPAAAGTTTYTWPAAPVAGNILSTDASGNLTWAAAGASGMTALTGDVTAAGSGSQAATIANDAVTFAKMQNIPTASLVGRYTAAAGDAQSITLGTGLALSGAGVLSNSVTDTDTFAAITAACASGTLPYKFGGIWTCALGDAASTNNAFIMRNASGSFAANVATVNGLSINNAGSVVSLVNLSGSAYTLTMPVGQGTSGQYLGTSGSGQLTWSTPSAGGLTNFTESVNSAAPNATVPVVRLLATNAASNADVAVSPKGSGALTLQVADSLASGGNKRGPSAIDFQSSRTTAAQVASGAKSFIGAGDSNNASGAMSAIVGGYGNVASADHTFVAGSSNTAAGMYAVATGWSVTATGTSSLAANRATTADAYAQATFGAYNMPKGSEDALTWVTTDPLFVIGNGTGSGASRSTAVMVLKNGNVGIGTTAPSTKLDVNGAITMRGAYYEAIGALGTLSCGATTITGYSTNTYELTACASGTTTMNIPTVTGWPSGNMSWQVSFIVAGQAASVFNVTYNGALTQVYWDKNSTGSAGGNNFAGFTVTPASTSIITCSVLNTSSVKVLCGVSAQY